MKKFLLLLFTTLNVLQVAADVRDCLRVIPTIGEPIIFKFIQEPEVLLSNSGVTITTTNDDPITFSFEDIDFFDFPIQTEIQSLSSDLLKIDVRNDQIIISNAPEDSQIDIINIKGDTILKSQFDYNIAIDRNMLAKGIYIIKVNHYTFKLAI